MKRFFALGLLFTSIAPLAADCFSWEFGGRIGYRWDHLRHTLYTQGDPCQKSIEETFENMSSAQIEGFTKIRLWWLEAGVDADYGWTVGGRVHSNLFFNPPPFDGQRATFFSSANGEVWDVFFTGGIRAPFYDTCDQGFFITPLGGYSFHGIREDRRYLRPDSRNLGQVGEGALESDPTFVSIPETNNLKRNYCGPFAGVSMSILYCNFYTNFGYAYHWIDLKQTFPFSTQVEFFTPSSGYRFIDSWQNCLEIDSNRGNRGWLSLNYQDPCGWRLGLRGTYFQVLTSKKKSTTTTVRETLIGDETFTTSSITTPPAKVRWQTFTAMLEAAYVF